jgi:lipopolysaccharide transport system permease protein
MFQGFLQQRSLFWQLLRRDIAGRYRGSVLGLAWVLLNPLLMLCVYTFVFSVVFSARWLASGEQPQAEFALILFAGLMLHTIAAEVLIRSTTAITAQVNYVKKVVFPLHLLPLIPLASAFFHYLLSLLVLLGASLLIKGFIPLTALWLPLILLPYALMLLGGAWFLAALGVYLRDITQVMGLAVALLLFLSPIFYPVEALPETWRPLLYANPLTLIISEARKVLLWGEWPDFMALLQYAACGLLAAITGYGFFLKTRRGFADVL